MGIMDDYKQLRMIENIKNLKEMEIAYKANLKLCKYQEQQINKLATCIEEIKEIARVNSINTCWTAINLCADCDEIKECGLQSPFEKLKAIIQIISEVENETINN